MPKSKHRQDSIAVRKKLKNWGFWGRVKFASISQVAWIGVPGVRLQLFTQRRFGTVT